MGCLKHGRLLRVTGRVPRVTGHVPRVTDHVPRVTDHVPRVTDHVPRARPRPRVDLGALAMSRGAPPPRTAPQSHVPMSRPRPYESATSLWVRPPAAQAVARSSGSGALRGGARWRWLRAGSRGALFLCVYMGGCGGAEGLTARQPGTGTRAHARRASPAGAGVRIHLYRGSMTSPGQTMRRPSFVGR